MPYKWLEVAFAVIAARGIEPHEVLQVLSGSRRRPVPAVGPDGLAVLTIWGWTLAGRPIIVTVRLMSRFDALIVGARDMTAGEKEEFETWETSQ